MIVELQPTKENEPTIRLQAYTKLNQDSTPITLTLTQGFVQIETFTTLEELSNAIEILRSNNGKSHKEPTQEIAPTTSSQTSSSSK